MNTSINYTKSKKYFLVISNDYEALLAPAIISYFRCKVLLTYTPSHELISKFLAPFIINNSNNLTEIRITESLIYPIKVDNELYGFNKFCSNHIESKLFVNFNKDFNYIDCSITPNISFDELTEKLRNNNLSFNNSYNIFFSYNPGELIPTYSPIIKSLASLMSNFYCNTGYTNFIKINENLPIQ